MLARRLTRSAAAVLCAATLAIAGSPARAQTLPPPLGSPAFGFPLPGVAVPDVEASVQGTRLRER